MISKRIIAAAMGVVFTLSIALSGCSSGKTEPVTQPKENTSSAQATETSKDPEPAKTSAEPVNLKFLTYDGVKTTSGEYAYDVAMKAYQDKNPNIKVTMDIQAENNSQEFLKKLDLMLLSGDTSDIIQISNFQSHYIRAIKDLFVPLDDYLKTEGINFDEKYGIKSQINGKYYAIPYNLSQYFVLINKKYLDEAGLSVPKLDWTWDDYREYAKKMTKGEGKDKIYGSHMHTWPEYRREALNVTKMDNPYVKDDGSSNMDDPIFRDYLKFIYDMENVDKCQTPYFDTKSTNMAYRDVFFNGKAAMILTGSWMIADIKNTQKYPHDFQTVFAPFPRWKDSPEGRTEGGYSFLSVNKNSKNKEEAYKFIRYMSNEGAIASTVAFPSEKGADEATVLKNITGSDEKLFDMKSLQAVFSNPKRQINMPFKYLDQNKTMDDIFNEETERYMVKGQDLDTTMANLSKRINEVIKK